jgi:hypothetical protein
MEADSSKALDAFGFVTVLESPEHGYFGGYLVLSPQGRPLEFRCTAPVAPSRAQEILYGPTLRPHLLADVLGSSLIAGAELPVKVILTDHREMLALALSRREEVLYVQAVCGEQLPALDELLDPDPPSVCLETGGCRVTAAPTSLCDAAGLQAMLQPLARAVHLLDPFERIRAALTEAQLASHEAAEYGDQSAAA